MDSIQSKGGADGPSLDSRHVPDWAPVVIYLLIAAATLGLAAFTASTNMIADQPNTDIWQHVAAVRALMENVTAPQNPFVVSSEPSRHFQPLWIATAVLGNALGLSVWQAVTVSSYIIMATLAGGVYAFARAYFASCWAPSVLLSVMLLCWFHPFGHTGLHSIWTFLYAAAYPASFLIGLSFLLWACVIKALNDRRYLAFVFVLSTLMLTTHQLGAIIGFVGAFAFAVAQPGASIAHRVSALAAIFIGCCAALAWPYFSLIDIMLRGGSSSWQGGPDFYASPWMPGILLPAGIGLLWMRHRAARPLALALAMYFGIYLLGLMGIQLAMRFLMPTVLILHIALAGIILDGIDKIKLPHAVLRTAVPWVLAIGVVGLAISERAKFQTGFEIEYAWAPDVYGASERATRDVPDDEPIAALSLAAWPLVAAGQRVLSVPWPEPGIVDLAERQAKTKALFDTSLSAEERRALAEDLGVRVLIADRRLIRPEALDVLATEAVSTSQDGTVHRFDLWD